MATFKKMITILNTILIKSYTFVKGYKLLIWNELAVIRINYTMRPGTNPIKLFTP